MSDLLLSFLYPFPFLTSKPYLKRYGLSTLMILNINIELWIKIQIQKMK